tara:strand:+ start:138 stop:317 length:180 start_codon:yes stop_codon:yes gene_type:complete
MTLVDDGNGSEEGGNGVQAGDLITHFENEKIDKEWDLKMFMMRLTKVATYSSVKLGLER